MRHNYKFYYIYKTTNLITGKIYVGQRRSDIEPMKDDYFGSGNYIINSINKYGKENFTKEILELCSSNEELNEREVFWIAELDSMNLKIGYNLVKGGNSNGFPGVLNPFYGQSHTQERIEEFRERALNREVLECPHCGVEMNYVNAYQYHFDKCPENPNIKKEEILNQRKRKMQKARKVSSEKITCPYCNLIGGRNNMSRYHFEHCEQAPVLSEKTKKRIKKREESDERRRLKYKAEPKLYICPYCNEQSDKHQNMYKYHFENCKQNPNRKPKLYKCKYCGIETENKTNITRWHNENCNQNPNKKKVEIICTHCGFVGSSESNMKRFHFDNCKQNPNNIKS